jgi:hypothetical protein
MDCLYFCHDLFVKKTDEEKEKRKNKYLIKNVKNKRRRILGYAIGSFSLIKFFNTKVLDLVAVPPLSL